MKLLAVFFTMLILGGSFMLAYAHPDPVGLLVQKPNDMALYTNELGPIVDDSAKNFELFSEKWFYHNFVVILAGVIVAIMLPLGAISYKEDIRSLISS